MSNFKVRDEVTGLMPAQVTAIEYLMTTNSLTEVATKVGIDRATLWTWLRDPRFKLRLSEEQQSKLELATSKWISLYEQSTAIVDRAVRGEEISADQRWAATLITKRLKDLVETTVLHGKLSELEAMLVGTDHAKRA